MRERKEIEDRYYVKYDKFNGILLEILLDIRELLMQSCGRTEQ